MRNSAIENKNRYNVKLLFVRLLGVTSTWQLVEIAGINFFTIVAITYVLLNVVLEKRITYKKEIVPIAVAVLCSMVSFVFHGGWGLTNYRAWFSHSIKASVVFLFILLTYIYLTNSGEKILYEFLKGVRYSCLVQLVWCYIQLVAKFIFAIDFNILVFNEFFKINNAVSAVNGASGFFNYTGLNLNAGILAPIFLFLFVSENRKIIKTLTLLMMFACGNTTTFITGVLLLFFIFFQKTENMIKKHEMKVAKKKFIYVTLIVMTSVLIVVMNPSVNERLGSLLINNIKRLLSIKSNNFLDGSTFVHFRYYQSIAYLISKADIICILFGYGFKAGGIPFVLYFGQYPDTVYGTESDPISFLYGLGLLGTMYIYCMFVKIVFASHNKKVWLFMILVLASGIFYSVQMNWLILVEFVLYEITMRRLWIYDSFKIITQVD